ncbi:MAG TPA: low molecular weight protein-tyrosine-phosphatase [Holophagaceae bacterium]|nr:low molecular weight protein-tyrosine-phosphatase [Holophagaceae bacterium]
MTAGAIGRILVLCEGNHCRGPLAEALLRSALPAQARVESAGLAALEDAPADTEAVRLARAAGLDLSAHRGRQVTPELAFGAELVLVMDEAQKAWCEALLPSVRGRVFLLGHWRPAGEREIPDPYRRGREAFHAAWQRIQLAVADWLPRLNSERRSA